MTHLDFLVGFQLKFVGNRELANHLSICQSLNLPSANVLILQHKYNINECDLKSLIPPMGGS